MSIFNRIKELRRNLGLTQKEFSQKLGVTSRALQMWESGDIGLKESSKRTIESTFNVSPVWFRTGDGGMFLPSPKRDAQQQDANIAIPVYDLTASAGYGAWVNGETIKYRLTFSAIDIKRLMGGNPKHIYLLYVAGASMEPTLYNRDMIAIDVSKTEAVNGLYVVRIDNELYVKRIKFTSKSAVLISDNPEYPPITAQYNDNFELIGRVVWFSRRMK